MHGALRLEEFRVPGAFRRRDEEEQAALRPWRVHPELVPFAGYSATTPAWPEAPSIVYTDGSATGKNSEDGAACKTGSGVYRAQPLLELCVDPCGLGPTNTITRAELVAIYSSLRHAGPADCVIATDSQASMFMVRNQLTAPGKNAYSTHNLLLEAIADELTNRARQGHGTRIIKVKSHTGVSGNEKADGLANAARLAANCAERVDLGNVAHRGQFWPALVKKDTRQMASNLCNGIKAHLGAHARGLANHTQYEGFWDRVLPELHALSFAFWTSAKLRDAIRRQVFMVRSGQTWHVGKALQYGRTYYGHEVHRNACIHCGEEDGNGHMLGGCKHPRMHGMYIERHNVGLRNCVPVIHAGSLGACRTIADAGAAHKMDGLETEGTRIPEDILKDSDLPGGPAQRKLLRPDLLLIAPPEGGEQGDAANDARAKRLRGPPRPYWMGGAEASRRTVQRQRAIVVEFGYCSDTRYHEKYAEKLQQHAQLKMILQAAGYDAEVLPILVGTTGCVYRSTEANLKRLGVSHEAVQRLLRKLAVEAARSARAIICTRRQLDSQSQVQRRDPP